MVVAQVLESLMFVHHGETSVQHGDADAFAPRASLDELIAAHPFQLRVQYVGVDFVFGQKTFCFGHAALHGLRLFAGTEIHVALDYDQLFHKGKPLDFCNGVFIGHHRHGVEPAALTDHLVGEICHAFAVLRVQREVGAVVQVGMVEPVPLDGFGIEITVRVKRGVGLVGEKDPADLLGKQVQAAGQRDGHQKQSFHTYAVLWFQKNIFGKTKHPAEYCS